MKELWQKEEAKNKDQEIHILGITFQNHFESKKKKNIFEWRQTFSTLWLMFSLSLKQNVLVQKVEDWSSSFFVKAISNFLKQLLYVRSFGWFVWIIIVSPKLPSKWMWLRLRHYTLRIKYTFFSFSLRGFWQTIYIHYNIYVLLFSMWERDLSVVFLARISLSFDSSQFLKFEYENTLTKKHK